MDSIEKKIGAIEFGLLSPEMIRKMSQIRVVTPDTYDEDGYPIEGGLMDLHMGVIDPGLRCKTCGGTVATCPGHFGHIELVRPVIHIAYVKLIYTLLKTTCSKCGRLLISPEEIEKYREIVTGEKELDEDTALEIIEKAKKVKVCPHCGAKQEDITLIKPITFYEGDQRLFPTEIRRRLEKIPDDDLKLLGIDPEKARPEWTILTVLPVPPVQTRPSITLETGERSEDDLTHKLVDILRINQRLRDNIAAGAPQLIIEDLWDLLQYHVTTYFNNEVSGIPPARHRSGRPLKTLAQRLKGKEGRFRYYLSGKRVNFSARTVISPDPYIGVNEVGVPLDVAKILTVPEMVTEWNINKLKEFIRNKEYPKALYIIRPDGRRKMVTENNREAILEELAPGYTVERQLMDGDIVLFNRQPSLHRISMMAHIVRVLPGKTFRIHPHATTPYNADFDGDEMNLHVPQTLEAQAEAYHLMLVQKQIISPRYGGPIIVPVQNYITSAYLMTEKNMAFPKHIAARILAKAGVYKLPKPDRRINGKPAWSGKLLFSQVLPKGLNLEYQTKRCIGKDKCEYFKKHGTCQGCPIEAFVRIKNGQLLEGRIEKTSLQGILLDTIVRKYGSTVANEFLERSGKMLLEALMWMGFTASYDDTEIPKEAKKKIKEIIENAKKEVDKLIDQYRSGNLERMPGKTVEETLEDMIMAILGKAREDAGKIAAEYLDPNNPYLVMTMAGARGSMLNLTQVSATLGQQAIRGKRVTRGYRNRTLPHFKEGDISARAKGFVTSCFRDGLGPLEYYFHSMSGRDSLVDKGIRPSTSGYLQRRLINALQDFVVRNDLTVRDATDTIVQFVYGEDGADPMKCIGDDPVSLHEVLLIEQKEYEELPEETEEEMVEEVGEGEEYE